MTTEDYVSSTDQLDTFAASKSSHLLSSFLKPLRKDKSTQLWLSPLELGFWHIALVICIFVARTIKALVGLGTPFVSVRTKFENVDKSQPVSIAANEYQDQLFELPDASVWMPWRFEAKQAELFINAIIGHRDDLVEISANNSNLALFLASISEPAMLLLLCKPNCPIRPLGAVNVRNRFEILNPSLCRRLFSDTQDTPWILDGQELTRIHFSFFLAKFPRPARRVKRGIEVDIEVKLTVACYFEGNADFTLKDIFRQEFTMLQFVKFRTARSVLPTPPKSMGLKGTGRLDPPNQSEAQSEINPPRDTSQDNTKPKNSRKEDVSLAPPPVSVLQQFNDVEQIHRSPYLFLQPLEPAMPFRWARLCKDYNPIHFSGWVSKLFGLPGQLIHGNHLVAMVTWAMSVKAKEDMKATGSMDQISQREHQKLRKCVAMHLEATEKAWWMEVKFKRPVVIPSMVGPRMLAGRQQDRDDAGPYDGYEILDWKTGKVAVEVTVGTMDAVG